MPSRRLADDDGAFSKVPVAGDVIAGKYLVENVVGTGGMGVVVSAQHLQLGQKVAIKVLSVQGLEDARRAEACARFLREGQAAARLTSDHVVRIYDVGTLESGAPFMVMELLRGEDLSTAVDRHGPAPVEVATDYIVQACDAVGEAHAHGIVHRDLKPSNLFVSRRNDGRFTVKVLDFGISKATAGSEHFEGNLTATRSIVGSPYYMSPEQVRDAKRVDTRTDVWSLGMILYELLVGEPAFNADTLPGICAAIAADVPPPIRLRRPDVPEELERIVLHCLEKDPNKRFQTVQDLVRALGPYLPRAGSTASIDYVSRVSNSFGSRATDPEQLTLQASESGPRITGVPRTRASVPEQLRPTDPSLPVITIPSGGGSSRRSPQLAVSATLVSGETTGSSKASAGAKSRSRAPLWAAAGIVFLGAASGAGFLVTRQGEHAPPPVEQPKGPARFSLSLESAPTGATVFEGDRVLGTTPVSITMDNSALSGAPRHFVLRLDGFEAYRVDQGPSESSVRVLATLSPLPQVAAPSPPPLTEPAPRNVARRAPLRPAPSARPSAPPSAPSDIRLER